MGSGVMMHIIMMVLFLFIVKLSATNYPHSNFALTNCNLRIISRTIYRITHSSPVSSVSTTHGCNGNHLFVGSVHLSLCCIDIAYAVICSLAVAPKGQS